MTTKDKRIDLRLTAEQKRFLKAKADALNLSISAYLLLRGFGNAESTSSQETLANTIRKLRT